MVVGDLGVLKDVATAAEESSAIGVHMPSHPVALPGHWISRYVTRGQQSGIPIHVIAVVVVLKSIHLASPITLLFPLPPVG